MTFLHDILIKPFAHMLTLIHSSKELNPIFLHH